MICKSSATKTQRHKKNEYIGGVVQGSTFRVEKTQTARIKGIVSLPSYKSVSIELYYNLCGLVAELLRGNLSKSTVKILKRNCLLIMV